ncbi:hemocyte protein-glutamine gamma-glutamyltransferase isoform X2 [Hydra vulgaris]|uniref:Hemocyte protein-glutamine gamma-glutamyltransferase isoform X2 n=1 Tax=Hydra vulgaris TaxID=6087 RepID=A0ABM4CER4_HYDVU
MTSRPNSATLKPSTPNPLEDSSITFEVLPDEEEVPCKTYLVKCHTGNKYFSGTSAKVSIVLHGNICASDKIVLEKPFSGKSPFQTGHFGNNADVFQISTKDIGYLWKIDIGHDNSGFSPSWYLIKVEVVDGNKTHKFLFNNWLYYSSTYHLLRVELETEEIPIVEIIPKLSEGDLTEHHTLKFYKNFESDNPKPLIVRRGLSFDVLVRLAREYEAQKDSFYFSLSTGSNPREANKTKVIVKELAPKYLSQAIEEKKWFYIIKNNDDPNSVLVQVYIPSNALVGEYLVVVEGESDCFKYPTDKVYILFNPWNEDDEVFMESEEKRNEYIMRQFGIIYQGCWNSPVEKKWYFGQFEEVSLNTAFYLLDKIPAKDRNAVGIARWISSLVSSNDEDGILVGNWSGNYEDGTAPSHWNGSPAILRKYYKRGITVKYGQCWVFSGLVTTILRTLGIPCRPVTNYLSAHESNGDCFHEIYYDEKGAKESGETIWNFHVWNEVWMKRLDLFDSKFDGWQAIDATPQEVNGGINQTGPAPLVAIKEGIMDIKYDVPFVFSEVNANSVKWKKNEEDSYDVIIYQTDAVGKRMSTKAVGIDEQDDSVINDYKYVEGSIHEIAALKNALQSSGHEYAQKIYSSRNAKVFLSVLGNKEKFEMGDDIVLTVRIKNTMNQEIEIPILLAGTIKRYNGSVIRALSNQNIPKVVVRKKDEKVIRIKVPAADYLKCVVDDASLVFLVQADVTVKEKKYIITEEVTFVITKPDLVITGLPEELYVGQTYEVVIPFNNIIGRNLTRCKLILDGTIVKKGFSVKLPDCPANEKIDFRFQITPEVVGKKKFNVTFNSLQLGGLCGSYKAIVL